jgi:hypothetical protein
MSLPRRPEKLAALPASLLLLTLLLCGAAGAQGPVDGAVRGIVLDLQGRPIAGATATLRLVDAGADIAAKTGRDGSFQFIHLAPGECVLTLSTPGATSGFAAPASLAIPVTLGETVEVEAGLRLSAQGVSLELSLPAQDQAGALATHAAGDQEDQERDQERDQELSLPGLDPDRDGDGLLSAHGLDTSENALLRDGAGQTQSFNALPAGTGSDPTPDPDGDADSAELGNGPANGLARGRHAGAAYTFSQSAVRETRVATPGYSAQTGHGAGEVVTSISRSGTAEFHGGASFVLRSQAFAAANPLAIATSYHQGVVTSEIVKPHDLRENFGVTAGGPLRVRPDMYFFYAFDAQRRGFPAISSPADPNFYSLTPTQTALLANRGVPGAAVETALDYLSSLTGSTSRRADQTIHFGRLDWRSRGSAQPHRHAPAQGSDLSLEYNRLRWNSPAGLTDAPVVARGRASIGTAAGSLDDLTLRFTARFHSRLVNQLRLGFVRDVQFEQPQTNLPQEPGIGPGGAAPEVNIAPNGLLFGTPATLSQQGYPHEQRLELADTLTLVLGHHLVEAGGEFAQIDEHIATLANAAGTFHYDSNTAKGYAGGLVDFITDFTFNVNQLPNGGCPSITAATHDFCFRSFTQSFGETTATFPTVDWAAFAEDTWRVSPTLTVHAGLRYEYTLVPFPAAPNPALDALFGSRASSSSFPEDRNNFGPRASFAWQPRHAGWSVRGGLGMFHGRLPGATILAALTQTAEPASTVHIRISPTTETPCPQAPANGFGYPCSFLAAPGGVVAATTSAMLFDRRFRLPAIAQGNLTLERRLGRKGRVSAGYVFNLGRQLPSSVDLNIAPATGVATYQLQGGTGQPGVRDGETFQLPLYTTRVGPSFGPVTDIEANANSTSHALAVEAQATPLKTLRLSANGTWSKTLDFGPSASATPRTNNQLDPFTDGYDKGISALNYPWSLHFAAVWQPRVRNTHGVARTLANGWQIDPLVTAHSGRPYGFDLSGGTHLPGGHYSLNGTGGALYLPTVGRNTLRLPRTVTTDLRVARALRLGGPDSHRQLRGSAEIFNLFNRQNVSSVSQRAYLVGTPVAGVTPLVFQNAANLAAEGLNQQPFGTPTGSATSLARERQAQFGLLLQF